MVKCDGTVRDSFSDVIQFVYGDDGMDAIWNESQTVDSFEVEETRIRKDFQTWPMPVLLH